jgi:hypothetical protein
VAKRTYGYAESRCSLFTSLQLFWVDFLNLGRGALLYVLRSRGGLLWLETKACGAFLELLWVLEKSVRVKK